MSQTRPRKDRLTYALNRKSFLFIGFIVPMGIAILLTTINPSWQGLAVIINFFILVPAAGCRSVDIGKSEPFGLLTIIPGIGVFVALYLLLKRGIYTGMEP